MATFKDADSREWKIEFDGLLLDEVQQATGIDIADLSAGGLFRLDQHAPTLVRVLVVLCGDERKEKKLTDREFSRAMRGDVLRDAMSAIVRAAENFFPPSTWSEMQSRLSQQKAFSQDWAKVQPLLMQLNAPNMPQAMRDAIMAALTDMMGNIGSPPSGTQKSAGGQDATPSMPASDLLANAMANHAA